MAEVRSVITTLGRLAPAGYAKLPPSVLGSGVQHRLLLVIWAQQAGPAWGRTYLLVNGLKLLWVFGVKAIHLTAYV